MGNRQLGAFLFPISGCETGTFSLTFLQVRESMPLDNSLPIRMQRWADRLWRQNLKCPVYPTTRGGTIGFLVPSEALERSDIPNSIQITDVPDRQYTLDITDHKQEITIQQASSEERDLICRMLERPFSDLMMKKQSQFWRAEWTMYFLLRPENVNAKSDVMNAYRGFKFGVVLVNDRPYLAIDIKTRYVGRKSLSEYSNEERESVLHEHIDLTLKEDKRRSFLRDNGPRKISCRYTGDTGRTVSEYEFEPGRSVLSYYEQQYKLKLDPGDAAVYAKDRAGQESAMAVPASRLFPVFTTDFAGIRSCSVKPWMSPDDRYNSAKTFLAHLAGAKLGNRSLTVKPQLFKKARTVFDPPRLEFGGGRILDPFQGKIVHVDDDNFDRQVVRFGSAKYPVLLQSGPQHNEPLPDLVLLYPDRLPREIRETFVRDISKEIYLQTQQKIRVIQHLTYNCGRSEKMGGSLLRRVPEVRALPNRCLALVILARDFDASVHGELKERIRPTLSQCVTEGTVYNIAKQNDPGRAKSQTRNLALSILIEAGVKPWVLADPLHSDAYIGIDLLYGRVAYHAFSGTGGRVITSRFGESQLRGRMREGIKAPLLKKQIEELVREITSTGNKIRSLVIHRDGRWWPSETKGFRSAISALQREQVLSADLVWAVVEVHKNHMPVRLLTCTTQAGSELLQNPLPGSYLILDRRRVLITTTGRPGAWDGPNGRTAGTLLLQISDQAGEIVLQDIAEDAFRLTHLNWSSPDIEISLPVTIRWADEALRETMIRQDEDESDGDLEDTDELSG